MQGVLSLRPEPFYVVPPTAPGTLINLERTSKNVHIIMWNLPHFFPDTPIILMGAFSDVHIGMIANDVCDLVYSLVSPPENWDSLGCPL